MHFAEFVILRSPGDKNHHMADLLKWKGQQDGHQKAVQKEELGDSAFFPSLIS